MKCSWCEVIEAVLRQRAELMVHPEKAYSGDMWRDYMDSSADYIRQLKAVDDAAHRRDVLETLGGE